LVSNTDLSPRQVVEKALRIAAEICIYTNDRIVVDALGEPAGADTAGARTSGEGQQRETV
jgi:hypothetical protein